MVKTAYIKTINRTVRSNLTRFISLISILLIGICFVTGIGGITSKVKSSLNDYLTQSNTADIIIKSKSTTGFTNDEFESIKIYERTKYSALITSLDLEIDDKDIRYYAYDFNANVNKLKIIKGYLPQTSNECIVEQSSQTIEKHELGEQISIFGITYTITGIVQNPLMYSRDGDHSIITKNRLSTIIYTDINNQIAPLPKTDIFIRLDDVPSYYSRNYLKEVNKSIADIKLINGFDEEAVTYLTLSQNKSYLLVDNICQKINVIAMIFPTFFIVVVALVGLTTMSRLVNEERPIIGCYKSLGYSNYKIISKYLFFSLTSSMIGCVIGLISGGFILPNIIYPAFNSIIFLPKVTSQVSFITGTSSSIIMIICISIVTIYEALIAVKETPSSLLLSKSPKPGKKIFLEKTPYIWKKMKFKYKSSFRNIFRNVGRLLMVVISVSGSTALVMAGFGLNDMSNIELSINGMKINVSSTLKMVSLAIIVFALFLCILVLFNLTNMNIGERKKEIATLKVLGYLDTEVYGYIFREILIMSIIGIIIGLPLGTGLIAFVFSYLKFGSISEVKWYSYLAAIILSFAFVGVVDLLLCKKIKSINMNDSLKSVE